MENTRESLVQTMEKLENMDSSHRGKGMTKIICEIWKFKRPSPFEGDFPSIYRKWGVMRALNETM